MRDIKLVFMKVMAALFIISFALHLPVEGSEECNGSFYIKERCPIKGKATFIFDFGEKQFEKECNYIANFEPDFGPLQLKDSDPIPGFLPGYRCEEFLLPPFPQKLPVTKTRLNVIIPEQFRRDPHVSSLVRQFINDLNFNHETGEPEQKSAVISPGTSDDIFVLRSTSFGNEDDQIRIDSYTPSREARTLDDCVLVLARIFICNGKCYTTREGHELAIYAMSRKEYDNLSDIRLKNLQSPSSTSNSNSIESASLSGDSGIIEAMDTITDNSVVSDVILGPAPVVLFDNKGDLKITDESSLCYGRR